VWDPDVGRGATPQFAGYDTSISTNSPRSRSATATRHPRVVTSRTAATDSLPARTETRQKAWDNYDVTTSSGLRIEVKASGYLQSWAQATHSRLSFGRVIARTWDANTNEFGTEPEVRADVFVLSVQICKDPQRYDALDLSQREFYVVAADRVRECRHKRVSIAWVRKHADPVRFSDLAATIERVGRGGSTHVPA